MVTPWSSKVTVKLLGTFLNSDEVYAFINRLSVETIVLLAYHKNEICLEFLAFLPKILLATLLLDRVF